MKIQWNWGTGLVVAMAAFMIMVLAFVSVMVRQDVSLVEADYYPKGQAYQGMIEKRANAAPFHDSIVAEVLDGNIRLSFPAFFRPETVTGEVHFYHRVSDLADSYARLALDDGGVFIFDAGKLKGRYILKIEWKQDGVEYYMERPVTID